MEEIRNRLDSLEYREHALRQMTERGIDPRHVQEALGSSQAEIIEEYPGHFYGPCCLILGWWGAGSRYISCSRPLIL